MAAPLMLLAVSWAFAGPDKVEKPKLTVKVTPALGGTAPVRIVASADLTGGTADTDELYCTGIEWDWGDDTKSSTADDCEPFVAGKSEIKRFFTADHTYQMGGSYRIQFRLKKKNKAIVSAGTSVTVRPGIRDPGGL
jgi:hypothetical protein